MSVQNPSSHDPEPISFIVERVMREVEQMPVVESLEGAPDA